MKKAICFSGGKDSAACLHMFKEEPGIIAIFCDTGATLPSVSSYVENTCKLYGVPLFVARPTQSVIEWQKDNGFPVDILPINSHPSMKNVAKENFGESLVSYIECCASNIWKPVQDAIIDLGIEFVIRGSKACDEHVAMLGESIIENGIEYHNPLWDWSDQDVFSYLKENSIPIMDHYDTAFSGLDCWVCTAYANKELACLVKYLKNNYPDKHQEHNRRLGRVRDAIMSAMKHYSELNLPSDRRLKKDIVRIATLNNGIPLYKFRYKASPWKWEVGVMADEVEPIIPEAVSYGQDGFAMVDYSKLSLKGTVDKEWLNGDI